MKWRSVGESWGTLGFGGDGGDGGGYDDCLIVDADAAAVDGDEGDTWPAPERVADRCCRIEEEAQNDVNIDDQGDHDSADGEKEEEAAGERLSHSKADSVAVAGSGEADEAVAAVAVADVVVVAAVAGDDKNQTDLERPDHCATSAVAAAVQPPCTTAWTPTCTADD